MSRIKCSRCGDSVGFGEDTTRSQAEHILVHEGGWILKQYYLSNSPDEWICDGCSGMRFMKLWNTGNLTSAQLERMLDSEH